MDWIFPSIISYQLTLPSLIHKNSIQASRCISSYLASAFLVLILTRRGFPKNLDLPRTVRSASLGRAYKQSWTPKKAPGQRSTTVGRLETTSLEPWEHMRKKSRLPRSHHRGETLVLTYTTSSLALVNPKSQPRQERQNMCAGALTTLLQYQRGAGSRIEPTRRTMLTSLYSQTDL